MPEPQNLRATGERIEQALEELQATGDPRTINLAEELLRLVHRALRRRFRPRRRAVPDTLAPELMDALVEEDELVASLLLVHGLHPESLDNRLRGSPRLRPAVLGPTRRRCRVARHRRGVRRGQAALARELRRLPLVDEHPPGGRRRGDRRSRTGDRPHRGRGRRAGRRRAYLPAGQSHVVYDTCPVEMEVSGDDGSARSAAADPPDAGRRVPAG